VPTTHENVTGRPAKAGSETTPSTIDSMAPAGSENSLGAESVRDGRPAACGDVVEAIDEEGPAISEAS
jgi:hypothetical protein